MSSHAHISAGQPSPTFFAGFREGLAAPWAGLGFMRSRPGLWRFGIIPVVLNLFITAVVLFGLLAAAGYFIVVLHPKFDGGWLWRTAEVLSAVAIFGVVVCAALIVWVILEGILCGYFYGKLAEQIERALGIRPEDMHDVPFSYQVVDTVADVGFLVMVNAGCLAIQIIPGIGSVIGLATSYYTAVMTLGMDYFEHPMAIRGRRRAEKRSFAKQHRPYVMGLGTVVAVLTLIPLVNAVLLTTAVAGAVLLHRKLAEGNEAKGESLRTDPAEPLQPVEPSVRVR